MRKILVLGAGRSSPALIGYLGEHARQEDWLVTVADHDRDLALSRVVGNSRLKGRSLNVRHEKRRDKAVRDSDIVVSLLPPDLHFLVAKSCLRYRKHLVTASYISPSIRTLDADARKRGVMLLNEAGLDPGIDHMSAMEGFEKLEQAGVARISGFRSYTGGLLSPQSADNPWKYKFTWNPRNVVLAGPRTARFLKAGRPHYVPRARIFTSPETIRIRGIGTFEAYPNRDSLSYWKQYRMTRADTIIRGTLREPGFCRAWDVFVKLGLTDESFIIEDCHKMTYGALVRAFLPPDMQNGTLRSQVARFCRLHPRSEAMDKIAWTGMLSNSRIGLASGSPADILQHLLHRKWVFRKSDLDRVVMVHFFDYQTRRKASSARSSVMQTCMVIEGERELTAIAKTVGLPLGMCTRLILNGRIRARGVHLPVLKEFYRPVLRELRSYGITFSENYR